MKKFLFVLTCCTGLLLQTDLSFSKDMSSSSLICNRVTCGTNVVIGVRCLDTPEGKKANANCRKAFCFAQCNRVSCANPLIYLACNDTCESDEIKNCANTFKGMWSPSKKK